MLVIQRSVKWFRAVGWLFLTLFIVGCSDPGARALLKGERFINEGKYDKAVTELQAAARLLPRHAQAWNHLGLAYHHQNDFLSARHAYVQALSIDYNLAAARYNLGCLLLENNDLPAAIDQLTSYTLLQPRAVEGWLRLGSAQLRARRLDAAEKSFKMVLETSPNHAEALNGLGNVQFYRRRNQEALALFNRSLEQNPEYAPAMLNAAVVSHQSLNNRALSLQMYRNYLAHQPWASNAGAVALVANRLDQELNPPAVPTMTATVPLAKTNPPPAPTNPAPRVTPVVVATTPRLTTAPPVITKPVPTTAPAASTPAAKAPPKESPIEVTRLSDDLTIKPVQDVPPDSVSTPKSSSQPATSTPQAEARSNPTSEEKRGLLSRLNPFGPKPKPGSSETTAVTTAAVKPVDTADAPSPMFPKYKYLSPRRPGSGNRKEAEKHFTAAVQSQRSGNSRGALAEYAKAVAVDPAYFEAHYNRGLAALELSSWQESLVAYEYALAIRPDSADARYNFALALKGANHIDDSIQQLLQLLKTNPGETRAHLSLANLYAYRLNQPKLARTHFAKVLEANPRHPQAAEIRFWLAAHPL